jgi:hypothetical protein
MGRGLARPAPGFISKPVVMTNYVVARTMFLIKPVAAPAKPRIARAFALKGEYAAYIADSARGGTLILCATLGHDKGS